MRITVICFLAFLLDLLWGDPVWLYHPVRVIGLLITGLEKVLRKAAGRQESGDTEGRKLKIAGSILWVTVCGLTLGVAAGVLILAGKVHPAFASAIEVFWCYQLLAAASLRKESMKVYEKLKEGDLPGARYAVSMIVGRDTEALTEEGVTKAAMETIAANT